MNCPCGRPLHYSNPETQRMVQDFIDRLGPTVMVLAGGRRWRIPRHYIALHGVSAADLPELAKKYHFEEVTE